ncbi:trypsin-like cysteine/serine peptidase domain-containing protein [Podospora aff. communis PSN243]|uniref:Trypsin-like cysteine/serine peptidase domain-containing protein n=1 Tax=Podospora aff. communis PSN243 TaxID=3040156 RepID=A0AAV9GE81_9PEZI|nr:trypsin-like cysteine/serine peptidase domain-containing protein [Podospora aff. communis PSN243]
MMHPSPRRTRAQRKQLLRTEDAGSSPNPIDLTSRSKTNGPAAPAPPSSAEPRLLESPTSTPISAIASPLPGTLPNLTRKDRTLLLHKQRLLLASPLPPSKAPLQAALVFAQAEAGTAVSIHPSGLLLTCAHCIAETSSELDLAKTHYLLFASGTVVAAKCIDWDGKRDLALLRITAAQRGAAGELFPSMEIAEEAPKVGTKLLCVGHPVSEDLECEKEGVATGYDVLHVSKGAFRGYADGQDLHDNEDIGALMHDCWTYWGHSGAPLVEVKTGKLIGVHSSWDDETGMRRGVGIEAIREFVKGKGIL